MKCLRCGSTNLTYKVTDREVLTYEMKGDKVDLLKDQDYSSEVIDECIYCKDCMAEFDFESDDDDEQDDYLRITKLELRE